MQQPVVRPSILPRAEQEFASGPSHELGQGLYSPSYPTTLVKYVFIPPSRYPYDWQRTRSTFVQTASNI